MHFALNVKDSKYFVLIHLCLSLTGHNTLNTMCQMYTINTFCVKGCTKIQGVPNFCATYMGCQNRVLNLYL